MGSPNSYGWASPLVVRLAEQDHINVQFCWQADSPTRHFVGLVLRGWENQGRNRVAFEKLAGQIHALPRRGLVQAFWDADPGNGLMPLLARLGGRTLPRAAYDALGTILCDPARRRLAVRQQRLSAAELHTLAQHDAGLVEIVGMEALGGFGEGVLQHAVEAVLVRRDDLDREQVLRQFRGLSEQDDLSGAVLGLLANCHLSVPWPGTERVRPLRTPAAMTKVARRFRNCLGNPDMQWQALRGDTFFYICDDGPSVAEVSYDRIAGRWFLHQVLGPRNRSPSKQVRDRLITAFGAAGFQEIKPSRLPWASTDSW